MQLFKKFNYVVMILGTFLILYSIQSCKDEKNDKKDLNILPGIEEFIKNNPEYGTTILNSAEQPDWAEGKRQEIDTDKGSFLFYLKNDKVTGVWKYNSDGTRTKIF